MATHAPSFRYHPTEAPMGRLFATAAELDALGSEWVDTPAAFVVPVVAEPVSDPVTEAMAPLRKKKGKPGA